MLHVTINNIFAYLYCSVSAGGQLLILSMYHNNESSLKGICANIGFQNESIRILSEEKFMTSFSGKLDMVHYHSKIQSGREFVYHSLSISQLIQQEYIFIQKEQEFEDLFSYYLNCFSYPLLREWIPYIHGEATRLGYLKYEEMEVIGDAIEIEKFKLLHTNLKDEDLKGILENGLSSGEIFISNNQQNALSFQNMDDYFEKYGHTLVNNLEQLLYPLSPMKEYVENLAFLHKSPFPQQAAIINGAVECLKNKDYVFLIESMGAGKTLQGMGVAEAYFNSKFLHRHPEYSITDLYRDRNLIRYRVLILCPPHLVEKWAESIRTEIPYAKVTIIDNLKQLVELRKKGKEPNGKEYYVLSKDSGKLSYPTMPVPYQIKRRRPKVPVCKYCREEFTVENGALCTCGSSEWELEEQINVETGLVCPYCGELLLPSDGKKAYDPEEGRYRVLLPEDFAQANTANRICRCCRALLWRPACKPVDHRIMFYKPKDKLSKWKKISHFTNKAKKTRKSVWVMRTKEEDYLSVNDIPKEDVEEMESYGPRRYGLTRYIKKYLKGYFELAIFDEVQEYKAGGSAQGYSMHDIIKATKKHICLTGTIAGGYASDLFYTLYRLDAKRMNEKGYEYGSKGERRFVEKYGTLETVYDIEENNTYHTMSRGRVITPTRCLPGISVLIFTEFLLDSALFLDLSDLSRYLPNLYEEIRAVPLEKEIQQEYERVRRILKKEMTEGEDKLLMGSYLQFSLSYTDMPYQRKPIVSPTTGEVVCEIGDFSNLIENNGLLNKERELIQIIQEEREQNRNIFIYCEYTGGDESAITYRLKEIIEKNCGMASYEVVVLESSYPAASKRELWMHQKASEGAKIFITNAKCVATGLDFAFSYQGKNYNYPTIIFYQTGYDMIKIWQASHRHYRLNQTETCKTYYLVSKETIQLDAVELIATKEVATSAIQGQFSSEGLATMAKGVDPRVVLAQSVAEKSDQKERGLRKMMDVLNQRNNSNKETAVYMKMKTFRELTGLEYDPNDDGDMGESDWIVDIDLLDYFQFDAESYENNITEKKVQTIKQEEMENTGMGTNFELETLLDFIF